jgi:hypothetical protein
VYVSFPQRQLDNRALNVLQDSQQIQTVSMTTDPRYAREDLNIQTDHNIRKIVQYSERASQRKDGSLYNSAEYTIRPTHR